jgi:hypothetical protein
MLATVWNGCSPATPGGRSCQNDGIYHRRFGKVLRQAQDERHISKLVDGEPVEPGTERFIQTPLARNQKSDRI